MGVLTSHLYKFVIKTVEFCNKKIEFYNFCASWKLICILIDLTVWLAELCNLLEDDFLNPMIRVLFTLGHRSHTLYLLLGVLCGSSQKDSVSRRLRISLEINKCHN